MKTFIFDVDGVLVDSPHEQAWGETLRSLADTDWASEAAHSAYDPQGYNSGFYQSVVAGKPRVDGARSMLHAFGLPDDDAHITTLCERKQAMIAGLILRGAFQAYPDAVEFLLRVREAGGAVVAASSSKNANGMLARVYVASYLHGRHMEGVNSETSLLDLLAANVSGRDIRPGKPHPKLFLTAAREAGADPADCVVVEDAPSGVKAAKAGGMKAIGIARHNDEELLREAGADWVVTSLADLDPTAM